MFKLLSIQHLRNLLAKYDSFAMVELLYGYTVMISQHENHLNNTQNMIKHNVMQHAILICNGHLSFFYILNIVLMFS